MTDESGLRILLRHGALLGEEIVLGMLESALRATHHHRIAAAVPELILDARRGCVVTEIKSSHLLSAIPGRTDLATSFVDAETRLEFSGGWQSDDERVVATLGAASWLSALWPSSPKGDESTALLEEIARLHLAACKPGRPSADAWRFGRAVAERQLARGDAPAARVTASALLDTLFRLSEPRESETSSVLERIEADSGAAVARWFASLVSDISLILADAAQCDPPDWEALDRAATRGLSAEHWASGLGNRHGGRFGIDPLRRAHLLNRRGVAARARGSLESSLSRAKVLFDQAESLHREADAAIQGDDWRADAACASTRANQTSLMIEQALKAGDSRECQRVLMQALDVFVEAQTTLDRPQLVEAHIATLNDAAWTAGQLAGSDTSSPFGDRSDELWARALDLARTVPNARVRHKWQQRLLENRAAARSERGAAGAEDDARESEAMRQLPGDNVQYATADAPYLSWHERGTVPTTALVGLSDGHFDRHRELLVLLIDMERDLRRFIDRVHCGQDGDRWLLQLAASNRSVRLMVERWLERSTIIDWNGNAPDLLVNATLGEYWVLMSGRSWARFATYLDKGRKDHWAWMFGGGMLTRIRNAAAHAKYGDVEEWEVVSVEAAALELIARMRTVL